MIIEDEITIPGSGEIIPPESKAAELFVPNGLDKILALIKKEVEQHQPDVSTEKGCKAIASLSRKVSSSMARLEDYGKNLSMNIKRHATDIDAERKRMKDFLTSLRDQARKPLTDYEDAVKARVEAHEQALRDVIELNNVPFGATVAEIEDRIAKLDEFALRQWEEFAGRFRLSNDSVSMRLNGILALTKKQDGERAAFAKSEEERIANETKEAKARKEKEQLDRDERIAREATERAEQASRDREAQSQRDKEAAEERARKTEEDAKAAAARAEQEKVAAVEAERRRQEAEQAAEVAAQQTREKDKAHKAGIHNAAASALVTEGGISMSAAKAVVIAIAQGKIPNVKVVY